MKQSIAMTVGATLVAVVMFASMTRTARAFDPNLRAQMYNWHGNYAYTPYGRPTALVVPPTAQLQTTWSWGAASSSISRIDHQFTRDYLGPGAAGMRHTPHWPRSTHQMGVYYVRGPWYPTQSQNRLAGPGCPCSSRFCSCARKLADAACRRNKSGKCDGSCGCCDEMGCCDEFGE